MSPDPQSEITNFKSQIPATNPSLPAPPPKNGELLGNQGNPRSFNLSCLQMQAIEHSLRGVRDSRIAEILGIDRKTLWNWKTFNEDYRRALAEGSAAIHAALIEQIQSAAAKAADALDDLLDDSNEQIRLSAAQTLLRSAAAFKPKSPRHQYHTPQSLQFGIISTTPEP